MSCHPQYRNSSKWVSTLTGSLKIEPLLQPPDFYTHGKIHIFLKAMNLGVVRLDLTDIITFRLSKILQVKRINEKYWSLCAEFEDTQTFLKIVTNVFTPFCTPGGNQIENDIRGTALPATSHSDSR